jgi:hypothetical protein
LSSGAILSLLLFANMAKANNLEEDITNRGGVSIGLGQIQFQFQEVSSILPVKSKSKSSSLVLISGGLYVFNRDTLFSIDNLITFYPGHAVETWTATGTQYNGITLTSPVLQQNDFSLALSSTQLLLHYRLNGHWFALAGSSFDTHSFKRYGFVSGPDNAVNTSSLTTVVESSSEVLVNLGVGLETEQVRNKPNHYSLRALVGLPVWRRLENTAQPQYIFSSTKGYSLAVEGRYSRAVHDNIQAGVWGRWSRLHHDKQTAGMTLELPASKLDSLGCGIELLWKL